MKRNEDSLRDLWDNIKPNNIRITGVPEGEEREKGPEKIFEEITVKNFHRASLVVQCLRVRLPMQETRVCAPVREDPTCRGVARYVSHGH